MAGGGHAGGAHPHTPRDLGSAAGLGARKSPRRPVEEVGVVLLEQLRLAHVGGEHPRVGLAPKSVRLCGAAGGLGVLLERRRQLRFARARRRKRRALGAVGLSPVSVCLL